MDEVGEALVDHLVPQGLGRVPQHRCPCTRNTKPTWVTRMGSSGRSVRTTRRIVPSGIRDITAGNRPMGT